MERIDHILIIHDLEIQYADLLNVFNAIKLRFEDEHSLEQWEGGK